MTITTILHAIVHYLLRVSWTCLSSAIHRFHHHHRLHHRRYHDVVISSSTTTGNDGILSLLFMNFFRRQRQTIVVFDDSGIEVAIGNDVIAEGGFSYILEAYPIVTTRNNRNETTNHNDVMDDVVDEEEEGSIIKKYALKRIHCANNHELIQACKREANIHKTLFQLKSNHNISSSSNTNNNNNLLELLGLKFVNDEQQCCCYMLFPYIPDSLRGEITKRNVLFQEERSPSREKRIPFTTRQVLQIFGGLVDALIVMHLHANLSHRDIKIENVLLKISNRRRCCHHRHSDPTSTSFDNDDDDDDDDDQQYTPILIDYGSAGPLKVTILPKATSAQQQQQQQQQVVLSSTTSSSSSSSSLMVTTRAKIVEDASIFTTLPYRPPELFEGGILLSTTSSSFMKGGSMVTHEETNVLDYGKVDVWSLGCVLFGLMHGASPFEMEFLRSMDDEDRNNCYSTYYYYDPNKRSRQQQQQQQQQYHGIRQYGLVRIVECTHLKILGDVPFPPWVAATTTTTTSSSNAENDTSGERYGKYPLSLYRLVQYMIHHDRFTRPTIQEVAERLDVLHEELLGERWMSNNYNQSIP